MSEKERKGLVGALYLPLTAGEPPPVIDLPAAAPSAEWDPVLW